MPTATLLDDITIHYEDDYFGAPWIEPEVVVLVHGIAESGQAWTQWVPVLSGRFRVIRPDIPGFGGSPLPSEYAWTPERVSADIAALLDVIGVERFHLVGAKYGGTIAMQLAADYPERIRSLSVFGSPIRRDVQDRAAVVENVGVETWAKQSQRERLGSAASDEQVAWWTDELMARANPTATNGAGSTLRSTDLTEKLSSIRSPTLVVTTEKSGRQSLEVVRDYQELISDSRLEVLQSDAFHPAAVEPERCAAMVVEFIASVSGA